jgi:hypothetical protein
MPRMRRASIGISVAALLGAAAPAQAQSQDPPKVPDKVSKAKKCGRANNGYADFRVYLGKGRKRITCKRARAVVRKGINAENYQYFDWTKGGNGPWSDVWYRHDKKVVVLAILVE